MRLPGRLGRLVDLPRGRRQLLWACGWALLRSWWQVRRWPFARLAAALGVPLSPAAASRNAPATADRRGQLLAHDVRWAVAVWSRALPRQPSCLMLAVAARQVLAARGVPCDLYFGVQAVTAAAAVVRPHAIGAHAWLRCGKLTVTGEAEAAAFQPIAIYRFEPTRVECTSS